TGEPKAPTPAAGNNTTRIATTAFVQAAITALINGAPDTLDTLKEIAAAINNDPKFSTTINNALSGKQPLDETLTHLSGKDVAGLLAYLGLGELALAGATTGAMLVNGYVAIPLIISGVRRPLIIQWGVGQFGGSLGDDAGYLNNFPFAFPSACYVMVASHVGHTPSGAGILSASAITKSGFRGFSSVATAANPVSGCYVAIGG
ncbi:phage tail protein, partial [Escherichia coli]